MFRVFFNELELNAFPARAEALTTARQMSRDMDREVVVEGPRSRFIYNEGLLDRYWYETRSR
jgi:hypothetical protein